MRARLRLFLAISLFAPALSAQIGSTGLSDSFLGLPPHPPLITFLGMASPGTRATDPSLFTSGRLVKVDYEELAVSGDASPLDSHTLKFNGNEHPVESIRTQNGTTTTTFTKYENSRIVSRESTLSRKGTPDTHKMPQPDTRSDEELFLLTLQGKYDDDVPWAAVAELQRQNTEAVFRLAAAYCESTVPLQRARGLDVLSQLGYSSPPEDRSYFDDCVAIAIAHLSDSDPAVVKSAAWALSHLGGTRAVSALLTMRDNLDSDVRWAVANGVAASEHPATIETLQHLMEDPDNNVRDWATFGLGTLRQEDSPGIRRALRQRLTDPIEEVRNEALWGLSHRKDREALTTLLSRLQSEEWLSGDEMAAAKTLDMALETPVDELCLRMKELL